MSELSGVYFRRGRESGVREESELEAPEQLFDYVSEDEYSRLVQRRQEEGFILDDGQSPLTSQTYLTTDIRDLHAVHTHWTNVPVLMYVLLRWQLQ